MSKQRHPDEISGFENIGYLKENFRLFHLCDSRMRDFDWHYHEFHKILMLRQGTVEYHIEGKCFDLKPYDILLIRKGEIHKPVVDFSQPYERFVLYVAPDYLKQKSGSGGDLGQCFGMPDAAGILARLHAGDSSRLYEVLQQMQANEEAQGFAGELLAEVLFLEFMILLNRTCLDYRNVLCENVRFDRKMIEIVNYINSHLTEELSIDQLAGLFFISKYHMMRRFKEETGYSIHQYILEKRIMRARDMISGGVPATAACAECGFKDYSTFNRAFKMRLAVPPSRIV